MRIAGLPALLLPLLAALPSAAEDPAPPPAPVPVPAPAPDPLGDVAKEMAAEVVLHRRLPFLSEVARRSRERKEVVEEFKTGEKDRTKVEGGVEPGMRTLVFFGLAPESDLAKGDAGAEQARNMAESVGGYYSSKTKTFTLVEGDGGVLNRMVVFHELVHAVEDQHYDLEKIRRGVRKLRDDDRQWAFRALVEGSAQRHTDLWVDAEPGRRSLIMDDILAQGGRRKGPPKEGAPAAGGAKAPPPERPKNVSIDPGKTPPRFLIRDQMFIYHNGSLFLDHVLAALPPAPEGTDPLARLYADPPASTEQVLHPEKYLEPRDLPRVVRLPDLAGALGEGWSLQDEDTWGELGVGLSFNAFLYPRDGRIQVAAVLRPPEKGFKRPEDLMRTPIVFRGTSGEASAGWDGDRYAVYGKGRDSAAAWVLVFDTEKDAAEFAAGYGKVLKRKYKGTKPGDDGIWTACAGGSTAVLTSGDRVTVAERIPPDRLAAVLDALKGTEVAGDPPVR